MAAAATLPSSSSPAVPTFRHRSRSRPRPFKAPPTPSPPPLLFLSTRKSFAANLPSPPTISFQKPDSSVLSSPEPPPRRRRPRRKRNDLELFTGRDGAISGRCRRLLHIAVQLGDLELARAVHAFVAKSLRRGEWEGGGEEGVEEEKEGGSEEETLLMNTLISTYLKLSQLLEARQLFEEMHQRDVISYTCMISAYAKCGEEDEAIDLFMRMRYSGVEPNAFSYVAVLTSCIRQPNSRLGLQLHDLVLKSPHCYTNVHVSNALMGFYVGCGRLDDAVALFEEMIDGDVTSWNTIISGMVKEGRYHRALELFQDMRMDGFSGDSFTISSLLTAAVEGFSRATHGEMVHAHALKLGLEFNLSVGNSLISFYTQFGCVEKVASVFDEMPRRDIISWNGMMRSYMMFGCVESAVEVFDFMPMRNGISYNVLLAGFCQNNEGHRALDLFKKMVGEGIEVSNFILTSVINACAMVGEVDKSKQIHAFVLKVGCASDGWIKAALLDMCTKCNRLEDAQKMFQQWDDNESHAIAWTSLICGYARNGQPNEAISLFSAMEREKEFLIMDEVLLTTEAEEVIRSMPFKPDASVWRALLDTSRLPHETWLAGNDMSSDSHRVRELALLSAVSHFLLAQRFKAQW
ncbi:hypothetical protein Taro_011496 [Colocasia esculenta]|uniref:Pentatricopeptide repeat-containing protein n=1 Tax=Colocasia esculenta TaxID=4460 RepID=A0A843UA44_COLES|nr:hypothetical protein [Colocasia esculenta]